MRIGLVRPLLLVSLLAGGWIALRTSRRPEPVRLATWAESALTDLFGRGVHHGAMSVDLLEGVHIVDLRVDGPEGAAGGEPSLSAREIEIRHDVLALTAGVPRLASVVLKGPRITAHETDDGDVAIDVPFDPPRDDGSRTGPLPSIEIVDGGFVLRASATSTKLRAGVVLEATRFRAVASPAAEGGWHVEGGFVPARLSLEPGEEITFWGTGDPTKGTLALHLLWDKLRLTDAVRGVLAPALLARLDEQRLEVGPHRLTVHLERDPAVQAGELRVRPEFHGVRKMDIAGLPGAETIDARTREQINELFGKIDLSLEVSGSRVDIREVTTSLAGGEVRASGKIEDGGEVVDVDLTVRGLRMDDPALWKALGRVGDSVRDEFDIAGTCDATVSLRRARGGSFRWEAVLDLVDATLAYKGRTDPVLKTPSGRPLRYGFPFAAQHCFGRIFVDADGVRIGGIEGRHGATTLRVRGFDERSRSGAPTGYVRFVDGDTDVVLTVDVRHIAVDADLEAAVEGSEFAGLFDTFRLGGVIDRVLLDILKSPKIDDAAAVEMDIDLAGEQFRYAPFPIQLEDVAGRVSLERARLPTGRRAKAFHIAARAKAAGGDVDVAADLLASDRRGRVRVKASGVRLEGPLEAAAFESPAIAGGLGETWEFLRPSGVVDLACDLPAADDPGPGTWDVRLSDVTLHLGGEGEDRDVTIEHVRGGVEVSAGTARLSRVAGRIGDGTIAANGTLRPGKTGAWDLAVEAKDLRLSRALLRAMDDAAPGAGALPAGLALEPGGHLDLDVRLRRAEVEKGRAPVTADVSVRRADLAARVGTLPVRVRGGFDVRGTDVALEDLSIEGKGIRIRVPRARVGEHGLLGSLHATLQDLEVTKEILGFLPVSLRPAFESATRDRILDAQDLRADVDGAGAMRVTGTLALRARPGAPAGGAPRGRVAFAPIEVSPADARGSRTLRGRIEMSALTLDVGPRIEELSGTLDLDAFTSGEDPSGRARLAIDRARVAGILVESMTMPITWREGMLSIDPIGASVYGGRLAGRVRVHTRAPVAFEGALSLTDASLERLVADVGSGRPDLRGRVTVDVEFQSRSGEIADLTAAGDVAVRDGDLGALPAIANVPALLASVLPFSKPPVFERADVRFTLADETITARRLVLAGPLFEMDGFGTLDLRGPVDLTLTPQFLKSLLLPGSGQIPGVRQLAGLLREDALYDVRVRGTLSDAKAVIVPFPLLGPRRDAPPEFRGTPFLGAPARRIPRWFR